MSTSGKKSPTAIGFLTVIEHEDQSMIGGYLVLNTTGRPLEFHCTAPVRPNRAQEILYGASLKPYLYGEQIGQTLIGKAKIKPMFVCTDVEPAMSVDDTIDVPVVLVRSQTADATTPPTPALHWFSISNADVAVAAKNEQDTQKVSELWAPHEGNLDLREPFDRIREALEEAQRKAA